MLLEWDKKNGEAPAPLLKDKFGSERRKAKTLNFSIAYGKTKTGLAKDWGVGEQEAEETILAWYEARKEVKEWQDHIRDKVTTPNPEPRIPNPELRTPNSEPLNAEAETRKP